MNARYDLHKHRSCALKSNANKNRSIKMTRNKMAFAKPYKWTATWLMNETMWVFWKDATQSHEWYISCKLKRSPNKLHSTRWKSICRDTGFHFILRSYQPSAHCSFARSFVYDNRKCSAWIFMKPLPIHLFEQFSMSNKGDERSLLKFVCIIHLIQLICDFHFSFRRI